jgi:hypothetical protein
VQRLGRPRQAGQEHPHGDHQHRIRIEQRLKDAEIDAAIGPDVELPVEVAHQKEPERGGRNPAEGSPLAAPLRGGVPDSNGIKRERDHGFSLERLEEGWKCESGE